MAQWTHMDAQGRARMVDVGSKEVTARQAVARGAVYMEAATLCAIIEQQVAKGDVLQVARIAGIMGTKQTPALIPMCHPLEITNVEVDLWPDPEGSRVCIEARVRNMGRTGVEMEALTAVTVAGLTVYDMCKSCSTKAVAKVGSIAIRSIRGSHLTPRRPSGRGWG
jgi:cyclic pyranopterin phosphate synthase